MLERYNPSLKWEVTEIRENKILIDIRKAFNATIPPSIRDIVIDLEANPLWRKIGETLCLVPPRESVDTFRLMNLMKEYIKREEIDPLPAVQSSVEELERKRYLIVKRKSPTNYFLAPAFAEAIRISKLLDEEIIRPAIEDLRKDPDLQNVSNLEQAIRQDIYNALKAKQ